MSYPGDLLEHLRSFAVLQTHLGRSGVFERASRELHVDLSVLRRRMQTIEGWVGAPLFEGRGPTLALSDAGRRLAAGGAKVLQAVAELRGKEESQRVTIACTGTITTELLPSVLAEAQRASPSLHAAVVRAGSHRALQLVADGEADIAVVRGAQAPSWGRVDHLANDRLWLVAPRGSAVVAPRRVTADDLAALPLVLFGESSQTRARVMSTLGPLGAKVRIEVDGKATALEYVRRGLGVSFLSLLPSHHVRQRGVILRDVSRLFPPSSFWIVTRPVPAPLALRIGERMKALARRSATPPT